jgi:thermitase
VDILHLHSILFLLMFLTLGIWLITKDREWGGKPWGRLAGFSILAYVFAFLFGKIELTDFVLDFALFIGGSFVINIFTGRYLIAFPLLFSLSGGYYYSQEMHSTKPSAPLEIIFKSTLGKTASNTIIPTDLDTEAEVLVLLHKGYNIDVLDMISRRYELTSHLAFTMKSPNDTDLDEVYALNIPDGKIRMLPELLQALHQNAAVAAVEVNEMVALSPLASKATNSTKTNTTIANDPEVNKMWAYKALGFDEFYVYLLQNKVRPRKKTRLAIIDTGIDSTHEDLKANLIPSRPEYGIDPHGHGTHCAGIAAAVSNNNKGISSFVWSNDFVEVVSIRVFDQYGRTSQAKIVAGMLEAADLGCHVISMSLGGPINTETQFIYEQAVAYANKRGAIVIVAAGNENMDANERAPAGVKGVITVAALNQKLAKADFSNDVSKIKMAIAAPGVDIYATLPEQRYDYMSGTSMATPYVAGLVAMLKSVNPKLDTEDIYQILSKSGQDTPQGKATGRCIQPLSALKMALGK